MCAVCENYTPSFEEFGLEIFGADKMGCKGKIPGQGVRFPEADDILYYTISNFYG